MAAKKKNPKQKKLTSSARKALMTQSPAAPKKKSARKAEVRKSTAAPKSKLTPTKKARAIRTTKFASHASAANKRSQAKRDKRG